MGDEPWRHPADVLRYIKEMELWKKQQPIRKARQEAQLRLAREMAMSIDLAEPFRTEHADSVINQLKMGYRMENYRSRPRSSPESEKALYYALVRMERDKRARENRWALGGPIPAEDELTLQRGRE